MEIFFQKTEISMCSQNETDKEIVPLDLELQQMLRIGVMKNIHPIQRYLFLAGGNIVGCSPVIVLKYVESLHSIFFNFKLEGLY